MSRDPVDEFLAPHDGEGLTGEQWDALLLEEEARREDKRREERAA